MQLNMSFAKCLQTRSDLDVWKFNFDTPLQIEAEINCRHFTDDIFNGISLNENFEF